MRLLVPAMLYCRRRGRPAVKIVYRHRRRLSTLLVQFFVPVLHVGNRKVRVIFSYPID